MNPLSSILAMSKSHELPAVASAASSEPLAALPVAGGAVTALPAHSPAVAPAPFVLAVVEPPGANGEPGAIHFAPGLSIQERSRINWESDWYRPGRGWGDLARAEAARRALAAPRPVSSPSPAR